VANKVYSLETNLGLNLQVCILSWIFISLGRVLGAISELYLVIRFGIYIDVLIIAIFFNGVMITYSFLTDAFNLFSDELTARLNEIEIVDLGILPEGELELERKGEGEKEREEELDLEDNK